jgi:hypothetical protein
LTICIFFIALIFWGGSLLLDHFHNNSIKNSKQSIPTEPAGGKKREIRNRKKNRHNLDDQPYPRLGGIGELGL